MRRDEIVMLNEKGCIHRAVRISTAVRYGA